MQNSEVEGDVFSIHAVMAYGGSRGRLIDLIVVDFDARWMLVLRFALLGRLFSRTRALLAQ